MQIGGVRGQRQGAAITLHRIGEPSLAMQRYRQTVVRVCGVWVLDQRLAVGDNRCLESAFCLKRVAIVIVPLRCQRRVRGDERRSRVRPHAALLVFLSAAARARVVAADLVQCSGSGMNSLSPGTLPYCCVRHFSFAASIRARLLATKFHQMIRSPSSLAPPTSMMIAPLDARTRTDASPESTAMCASVMATPSSSTFPETT